MWASHRVKQLLRKADRDDSRSDVIDQIVELGESYSIVTPYTSVLVLENDDEYRRWKINRRNALRIERDRERCADLQHQLERLRAKSLAQIGPQTNSRPPLQVQSTSVPPKKPPIEHGVKIRDARAFDFVAPDPRHRTVRVSS